MASEGMDMQLGGDESSADKLKGKSRVEVTTFLHLDPTATDEEIDEAIQALKDGGEGEEFDTLPGEYKEAA